MENISIPVFLLDQRFMKQYLEIIFHFHQIVVKLSAWFRFLSAVTRGMPITRDVAAMILSAGSLLIYSDS